MNTVELVAAVRTRLDDIATPTLISTETILEQASLTQTEFARATLAIYNIASAAIVIADPWLTIPDNLFVLKTIVLNGKQLRPVTTSELDFGYYSFNNAENTSRFDGWRSATGTPKFVVTDMYHDKIRLVPSPTFNATVSLEGYVAPDVLVIGSVIPAVTQIDPQIPLVYHELLLVGTVLRLYSLFDIDTVNPVKAQIYATQWQQGLIEAQNNLRTSLRRQVRVMELPRGFIFDSTVQKQEPVEQTQ